jgi:hypothetical protein
MVASPDRRPRPAGDGAGQAAGPAALAAARRRLAPPGGRQIAPAVPLDTLITPIYSHALNIKVLYFFAH